MGKQSLYNVHITVDVKGYGESDGWSHLFGFRKIESHIDNATGGRYCSICLLGYFKQVFILILGYVVYKFLLYKLFKVNGEPIFIRGGN